MVLKKQASPKIIVRSRVVIVSHPDEKLLNAEADVVAIRKFKVMKPGNSPSSISIRHPHEIIRHYTIRLEDGREIPVNVDMIKRIKRNRKIKPLKVQRDLIKNPTLLQEYVSVVEYGILKKVTPGAVYDAIKRGSIKVDIVGMTNRVAMVNWEKYKDVNFVRRIPEAAERTMQYYEKKHGVIMKRMRELKLI